MSTEAMYSSKNKTAYVYVLSVLMGLIVRLLYCIIFPVQPRDTYKYVEIIQEWESTGVLQDKIDFFPLSLWIMKIPHRFFRYDIVKGGIIVNLLLGIMIIIITMKIIESVFGSKNGLLLFTGIILATHFALIHYSCKFLRENSYLFCFVLAIYTIIKAMKKNRNELLILSGILCAAATLCRLEGIELAVIVPVLIIYIFESKKIRLIKTATALTLFTASYIMVIILFIVYFNINRYQIDNMISNIYDKNTLAD